MINQASIRLRSKAFRWLHKSCASNIAQDHKTKIDFDKCSNDLNWYGHQSAQCHITSSAFPGLYSFASEVTVPTSRYLRIPGISYDSWTSFHASDTRENHNIQQILTHLLFNNFLAKFELRIPTTLTNQRLQIVYHCVSMATLTIL